MHQAQVAERVLDLGPLEEAEAAVDAIGNAGPHQGLLQHPRLGVGAVQNRHLVGAAAVLNGARDAFSDEAGFIEIVVGGIKLDGVADRPFGPQGLGQAPGIVPDQGVGGVEDGAGGAVVLLQANGGNVLELVDEGAHVFDAGAAPTIDGLIVVAHRHDMAGIACQQLEPVVLDAVGVLEFIDQDVPEPAPVVGEQRLVAAQALQAAQQQFGEIDQAPFIAQRLVALVDALVGDLKEVVAVRQRSGAASFILVLVDGPNRLAHRPAVLIDVQRPHHPLDQPLLVVGIEDLEVLRQPRFLPVHAQQAVGDAMEGAHPKRADRDAQQGIDPLAHLRRRLVGEGHRQQAIGRDAFGFDQPSDAMHQHPRLAAAGAGHHQGVAGRRSHRLALRFVQASENVGDVHSGRGPVGFRLLVYYSL